MHEREAPTGMHDVRDELLRGFGEVLVGAAVLVCVGVSVALALFAGPAGMAVGAVIGGWLLLVRWAVTGRVGPRRRSGTDRRSSVARSGARLLFGSSAGVSLGLVVIASAPHNLPALNGPLGIVLAAALVSSAASAELVHRLVRRDTASAPTRTG